MVSFSFIYGYHNTPSRCTRNCRRTDRLDSERVEQIVIPDLGFNVEMKFTGLSIHIYFFRDRFFSKD